MSIRIALAGNPNSGKTTLFNALTGANQFVGNWPGVTVEKKEGKLKKHADVVVTDLPGIYSLSPYTPEEVVARNYLVNERPDVILNIVDGMNLERNLYLTTQLLELGIPAVIAVNMADLLKKSKDEISFEELSRELNCPVLPISALKGTGLDEVIAAALNAATEKTATPMHVFSGSVEHAIAHIEEAVLHERPEHEMRWYAVKLFERDEKVQNALSVPEETLAHIENDIAAVEKEMEDDAESIITNERYVYIAGLLKHCYKKKNKDKLTVSDKIDRIVTNRFAALPIFALVMFVVYFISVTTVGAWVTDWTNDALFGDGFHFLGIGSAAYEERAEAYDGADTVINAFLDAAEERGDEVAALREALDTESETFDAAKAGSLLTAFAATWQSDDSITYLVTDEETLVEEEEEATGQDLSDACAYMVGVSFLAPDPSEDTMWIPGIPVLIEKGLDAIHCADWLKGLILDGIVAGVGAVLGFVPQMLILFLLLAFLEACGYMARIAFVMDRIFRKFGLSGKSFIPMLIGTGCGVPGIMASRTIENERDRRMTVMTTTFIPCGAKIPFIGMIAGIIFGGAWWVAPSAYFLGMAAIILSGILLKKTRPFAGDPAPFVMELPAYHLPTVKNLLRSMWERGWSFIKKAGTIILLSTVVVWFTTFFGFVDGGFRMLSEEEVSHSILAYIGTGLAWIFAPLGFGNWQATVASITGLVAKENIVGTIGILYGAGGSAATGMAAAFTKVSGYAFLAFNLLCAPCFAAIGAIRREMNSAKWTWFAIGYQCGFAYFVALVVNQLGLLFTGNGNVFGSIVAFLLLAVFLFLVFRPSAKKKAAVSEPVKETV